MRIGLFVDVDKTLTVEVIQAEFAKHLGCLNEFKPIEDRFQKEEIELLGIRKSARQAICIQRV